MPAHAVLVGRISGVFGVRGDVKVVAADGAALRPGLHVALKLPGGEERAATIQAVRPHKNAMITRLDGVDGADAARLLQGAHVFAARSDLPKLAAHAYREADLVGMHVVDAQLGELGCVRELRRYPSCHMLVVGEKKLLVPMLHAYALEIDVAAHEIRVRLPAGFEELL